MLHQSQRLLRGGICHLLGVLGGIARDPPLVKILLRELDLVGLLLDLLLVWVPLLHLRLRLLPRIL